jgi:hypothetical protein
MSQGYTKNILKTPDGSTPTIENVNGIAFKTSALLTSNGSVTTGWITYNQYLSASTVIFSDVTSATNGLVYQYSSDGGTTILDTVSTTFNTLSEFRVATFPLGKGTHIRITYTNGVTTQTKFYLSVSLGLDVVNSMGSVFTPVNINNIASITKTFLQVPDTNLQTAVYDFVTRTGNSLNTNVTNLATVETSLASIDLKLDGKATELKQNAQLTELENINIKLNDSVNVNILSGGGTVGASLETTQLLVKDNQTNGTQVTQLGDGVNKVSVKNSLTSPVAIDKALVTSLSPNGNTIKVGETIFINSVGNTSVTQLTAGQTFTGTIANLLTGKSLVISTNSNLAYTVNVTQFNDLAGTQNLGTETFTRLANQALNIAVQMNGDYARVSVTNNGVATTVGFFVNTYFGDMPPFPNSVTNSGNFKTALLEPIPIGTNRIGTVGLNDGTNNFTIKPASTSAITTDTALVVTMSPNSATTNTSDASNGSVGAGVAGTKSSLAGLVYNLTTPTLTNAQQVGLQGDINGNLRTVINTIGSSNASVDTTITLGGTAQTLIVANANRKYLVIQNTGTLDLRIKFGGTASATVGFILKPDSSYTTDIMGVYTGAISVFGTTTNQPYSYWEV